MRLETRPQDEKKESHDASRHELLTAVQQLTNLPSQVAMERYSSYLERTMEDGMTDEIFIFLEGGALPEGSAEFSEDEARDFITSLVRGDDLSALTRTIDFLEQWVACGASQNRLTFIEREIANHIERGASITLSMLALLGRINSHREILFTDDALSRAFEIHGRFARHTADQLAILNRLNHPGGNALLHSVLDFMRSFMEAVQDHVEDELEKEGEYYGGFFMDFHQFAKDERQNSKNYLVQKHLQDAVDLINMYDSPKEGALAGVPGGATDEMIYTVAHIQDIYTLRRAMGISDGYPVKNPVLPLTRGYVAYYENGIPKKIFAGGKKSDEEVFQQERELVLQSDPDHEYDYVYDELNEPMNFSGRYRNPSSGLRKLEVLWDLSEQLKARGRSTFFYDLSRIDTKDLHPFVLADILTRNEEYLKEHVKQDTQARLVPGEEFNGKLSPQKNVSSEKIGLYRYLLSLQMRKRIEEDFSIDISTQNPWVQRNFLEYLNTRSVEEINRVQRFVKEYGGDGLKTFLVFENDPEFTETVLAVGEERRDVAQDFFAAYAKFADSAYAAGDYVRKNINRHGAADEVDISEMVRSFLSRGKALLENIAHGESVSNRQIAELRALRKSVLLFSGVFYHEWKNDPNIDFTEFRNLEFFSCHGEYLTPKERKQLYRIADQNYPTLEQDPERGYTEEFRAELLAGLEDAVEDENTEFYLVKHKNGDVIAFDRFRTEGRKKVYFGSFNVNPKYRGFKIGDAMMAHTLDRYAAEGYEIHAICDPRADIARAYIKRGFVATRFQLLCGAPDLVIERNDALPYESQQWKDEEIVRRFEEGIEDDLECVIQRFSGTPDFSLLDSAYVLTRWIKQNTYDYCVFELAF